MMVSEKYPPSAKGCSPLEQSVWKIYRKCLDTPRGSQKRGGTAAMPVLFGSNEPRPLIISPGAALKKGPEGGLELEIELAANEL